LRNTDQSAGRLGETGEQNQPEPAHGNVAADAARQDGAWTTPEDLAELFDDVLHISGISVGRRGADGWIGLSRHDLVTPRALVALLLYAQKQPWFEVLFRVVAGGGIDGTLEDRMKNSIAMDGCTPSQDRWSMCARVRVTRICPTGGG